MEKAWYDSKTLWVNVIALIAFIAQKVWGYVIDPATQIQVLLMVNIILRIVTKEEIVWGQRAKELHGKK